MATVCPYGCDNTIYDLEERIRRLKKQVERAMETTGTGTLHYVILREALEADGSVTGEATNETE